VTEYNFRPVQTFFRYDAAAYWCWYCRYYTACRTYILQL